MWGCRAETEGTTGNSKKRHEIKWGKAETTDRENPPAAEKAGSSAGESGGLQLCRAGVMDLLVQRAAAESETTYAPSSGWGCSNNRNWSSQLAFNFLLRKWEWQLKGSLEGHKTHYMIVGKLLMGLGTPWQLVNVTFLIFFFFFPSLGREPLQFDLRLT